MQYKALIVSFAEPEILLDILKMVIIEKKFYGVYFAYFDF